MTMKGELLDRDDVDIDFGMNAETVVRLAQHNRARRSWSAPGLTTMPARLLSASVAPDRFGRMLSPCHRFTFRHGGRSRFVRNWPRQPPSTCTAISAPRRWRWPKDGWVLRRVAQDFLAMVVSSDRRRRDRAERATDGRCHRQRRPRRARRGRTERPPLLCAVRVAVSMPRPRARRSRPSPAARTASRPTRSCNARVDSSAGPWHRSATCSISIWPSLEDQLRSGSARRSSTRRRRRSTNMRNCRSVAAPGSFRLASVAAGR